MITINLTKARSIAHDIRRGKRSFDFEPLDAFFVKRIPGVDLDVVETQRQQVRDKYAQLQEQIDNAKSVDELSAVVKSLL